MFEHIRIQMVQPCRAKCQWCSTHKKNPTFQNLVNSGEAEQFHEMYLETIDRYRPKEVFISGGEPLLYSNIESFLATIAPKVERIHLFSSYQFATKTISRIETMALPDNLVINHTPIYFEPERWHRLTQGFPFEVYLENIRRAVKLTTKKRFKFIVNHGSLEHELELFIELVKPNSSCEITFKLMNDQGNGMMVDVIKATAHRVFERLGTLDSILDTQVSFPSRRSKTSIDLMKPVLESGDVSKCIYRRKPIELRLAFYRGDDKKKILKYRYCPYFPPDVGNKFHIGKGELHRLERDFHKGDFRDHCNRCRLLHYRDDSQELVSIGVTRTVT